MKGYPLVQDEFATIRRLLQTGESLARFGDGETKMMIGVGNKYEAYNKQQAKELKYIATGMYKNVAVGIPAIRPELPRAYWWEPWKAKLAPFLCSSVKYCSSFISRPDHVPALAKDDEFRNLVAQLWAGKRVALVGSGASLTPEKLSAAASVEWIKTIGRNDYERLDEIMNAVIAAKPEVAVLCAGMVATCMVPSLTELGIKAYDLGAFGQNKLWNIARAINAGERTE